MKRLKALFKRLLAAGLGWQVRRLRRRRQLKIIGVVGSYGKTSTKLAVAHVLGGQLRVLTDNGNYNDLLSVPLVFFGRRLPNLYNPLAWLWLLLSNEVALRRHYPFEAVVLELGTDCPGQIKQFATYLALDIAIVTAIAEEHMEFFDSLEAVAAEELGVAGFTASLLINADLASASYLKDLRPAPDTYGFGPAATIQLRKVEARGGPAQLEMKFDGQFLTLPVGAKTDNQLYSLAAGLAAGLLLGLEPIGLITTAASWQAPAGRGRVLAGLKNSQIIDETYNSSPDAAVRALDVLYQMPGRQKIALLGSMNELGRYSAAAHQRVGAYCHPDRVNLVVTLGDDANRYLAAAAERNGCRVVRCASPTDAAKEIRASLLEQAVILAKGSQNGVFAEEAIKQLLANPADAGCLVRQSPQWLKRKASLQPPGTPGDGHGAGSP